MKKLMAFTMCVVLILSATVLLCPQNLPTQTKYYADSFYGGSDFTNKVITIPYSERTINNKLLVLRPPEYVIGNITCVPIAGANIIGFYDRYYENLIPNFVPGFEYGTHYLYKYGSTEIDAMAFQLAADMGLTSPSTQGATVAEAKSGITKYCTSKSLNVSFTSTMKWSFDYELAKSQIISGKPIIIFCSEFNLATLGQEESDVDTIYLRTCKEPHAMAIFGYYEVTYKLSNGTTRIDKYLNAATGIMELHSAMVYMGSDIKVDNAYAVTVY